MMRVVLCTPGWILTDVLQAGPFQGCTAPQVEMDDKRTIVLQNLLHCAVWYPVFFHREVDLTGTHTEEKWCTCFKYDFIHCCEFNTRRCLSVQTSLHKVPDWIIVFHVQHTSAQFSQSRRSKYLKICGENNSFDHWKWKHLYSLCVFWSVLKITLYALYKLICWWNTLFAGCHINMKKRGK